MNSKLQNCKVCGNEIAGNAKICPHCGAKQQKPFYKKWWVWAIIAVIFIGAIDSSNSDNSSSSGQGNIDSSVKNKAFSGDCGISATAEMGTSIIGQPTINISITNTTIKDICAIKFYAIPLDVYGEEIKGFFAQNNLYTDDTIVAGDSSSITYQFLSNEVKTIRLYVYSVYYNDGTQWGDKDATKSVIIKNGMQIQVDGKSEK